MDPGLESRTISLPESKSSEGLGNTADLKLNNARIDFAAIDLKLGHSNWQPKAARPCAAGIDVYNSVATLDDWPVRVA